MIMTHEDLVDLPGICGDGLDEFRRSVPFNAFDVREAVDHYVEGNSWRYRHVVKVYLALVAEKQLPKSLLIQRIVTKILAATTDEYGYHNLAWQADQLADQPHSRLYHKAFAYVQELEARELQKAKRTSALWGIARHGKSDRWAERRKAVESLRITLRYAVDSTSNDEYLAANYALHVIDMYVDAGDQRTARIAEVMEYIVNQVEYYWKGHDLADAV
jgi:hypothetical protein